MNEVERALQILDSCEENLAENHTSFAIRHGGWAVWEDDVVAIGLPADPVDGDHEHTLCILFCAGNPLRMAELCERVEEKGITHICWSRGVKAYGKLEWQKHSLREWMRLVRIMNRRHGQ